MKGDSKDKIMLYIKDSHASWIPIADQTQKIRNSTNLKIRQLGNKYYIIKTLIERLNIKRDDLFKVGKQLEEEYKDNKKGIHLYTQNKRMKESLYCWFAEHFFTEIIQNDSYILRLLAGISKNKMLIKEMQANQIKKPKEMQANQIIKPKDTIQDMPKYKSINDSTFNQEIDTFDFVNDKCVNSTMQNEYLSPSVNPNFEYDKLFIF